MSISAHVSEPQHQKHDFKNMLTQLKKLKISIGMSPLEMMWCAGGTGYDLLQKVDISEPSATTFVQAARGLCVASCSIFKCSTHFPSFMNWKCKRETKLYIIRTNFYGPRKQIFSILSLLTVTQPLPKLMLSDSNVLPSVSIQSPLLSWTCSYLWGLSPLPSSVPNVALQMST